MYVYKACRTVFENVDGQELKSELNCSFKPLHSDTRSGINTTHLMDFKQHTAVLILLQHHA